MSNINKKNTLLKENNNKIPYVSEVIKFLKKKKGEVNKKYGSRNLCSILHAWPKDP